MGMKEGEHGAGGGRVWDRDGKGLILIDLMLLYIASAIFQPFATIQRSRRSITYSGICMLLCKSYLGSACASPVVAGFYLRHNAADRSHSDHYPDSKPVSPFSIL